MIEIDGFWWFVGAVLICGLHALDLWAWKREQQRHHAWWVSYDARAQERHDAFMHAMVVADEQDDDEQDDDEHADDEHADEQSEEPKLGLDPATQKIVDDFDAHAKKRAAELLVPSVSPTVTTLQLTRLTSFCLGYKAGVIDLGAAHREEAIVDVARMSAVFSAAIAWRDSPRVDASSLAGTVNGHEARLITAVDAARTARKEGSV